MIALVDIKKAVSTALSPTGLTIYGSEVKEGFTRPCFFVNLLPIASDTFKTDTSENSLMVEIVYFSANKTDLENLKMYDVLKGLFSPTLSVGTRKIRIEKFRAEVIDEEDHIYAVKFDLNFYDEIVDNTAVADPMTTLNLNIGGS